MRKIKECDIIMIRISTVTPKQLRVISNRIEFSHIWPNRVAHSNCILPIYFLFMQQQQYQKSSQRYLEKVNIVFIYFASLFAMQWLPYHVQRLSQCVNVFLSTSSFKSCTWSISISSYFFPVLMFYDQLYIFLMLLKLKHTQTCEKAKEKKYRSIFFLSHFSSSFPSFILNEYVNTGIRDEMTKLNKAKAPKNGDKMEKRRRRRKNCQI